jgi:hypothetical protein
LAKRALDIILGSLEKINQTVKVDAVNEGQTDYRHVDAADLIMKTGFNDFMG